MSLQPTQEARELVTDIRRLCADPNNKARFRPEVDAFLAEKARGLLLKDAKEYTFLPTQDPSVAERFAVLAAFDAVMATPDRRAMVAFPPQST